MENFLGIFLIVIIALILLGPLLQRWVLPYLQRWIWGRMEDNMRRMAGMPTRKEEKKARKKASKGASGSGRNNGRRYYGKASGPQPMDLMRSYAEDVEYTEIKSYSDHIEIDRTEVKTSHTVITESQVEDADFEDIR